MVQNIRANNRRNDELRPLKVTYDILAYASGSVLFQIGNTKVICAITRQQGVPHFLRGKKSGWLTAEYSLLPASTPLRTIRDSTSSKRNGRTIEISRLIGRALRSIIKLDKLGEQTIFVDCDVLQADGGTRTASITGAYLALRAAISNWIAQGIISENILTDEISAISVGISAGESLLDIDFKEDSTIDADFNYVLTRSGKIIEIQGSAEKFPVTWQQHDQMKSLALLGVNNIFEFFDNNPYIPKELEFYQKFDYIKSYENLLE